jgi:hypothetical protein
MSTINVRTVPIDSVTLHPHNANRMSSRTKDRIRRHIADTGKYPIPVVRSLEESVDFADLHAQGKLQMLDGEHRLSILRDLGYSEIAVDVWPGITDGRALMLLATLNDGGQDDPVARAKLIKRLVGQLDEDAANLEAYLPETAQEIQRYAGLTEKERKLVTFATGGGGGGGAAGGQPRREVPFTLEIFLPNREAKRKVEALIEDWCEKHDPDRRTPYREGVALMTMLGIQQS